MFSSKTDLWATPQDFYDKLNSEFNFTLDPCATPHNAKCVKFYTKEQGGGEDVIQIGCKRYTISEWQKHFRIIGEAEGYSPEQMEEYKGYIDLIAAMHKTWALH